MVKSRILILNSSDNHGGAAKAAFRLMLALLDNNYEVNMLVCDKSTNHPNVYSYHDFEKKNLLYYIHKFIWKFKNRISKQKWKKYPNREKFFLNDLNAVSLIKFINKFDFDILHIHFVANRFLDLNELKKINKPIIWTLHDSWTFTGICHFTYECENYKISCGNCPMLKSIDKNDFTHDIWKIKNTIYNEINLKIISPSDWLANQARNSSLLKNKTIEVIPNIINFEVFKNTDKLNAKRTLKLDLQKKHIVFGAVNSTSDLNKGYDLLLKSLNLLNEKEKSLVELVIFGNNEKENSLIGFNTIYLGYINDDNLMSIVYNAADVVVVPSRSENLSNTIFESLACGTPVAAYKVGGNSDLIDHMLDGYLAYPFDAEDLNKGILWCLNHPEIKVNCIQKIQNHFSEDRILNKLSKFYSESIQI